MALGHAVGSVSQTGPKGGKALDALGARKGGWCLFQQTAPPLHRMSPVSTGVTDQSDATGALMPQDIEGAARISQHKVIRKQPYDTGRFAFAFWNMGLAIEISQAFSRRTAPAR